ncbi:hypothetical protein BN946_scf184951.g7 [Trametes cinnabarina]|uniref:EF-hand domain-containing protein n=1 Tax=Pycnoporus cinnabarinus TaxID=5643 RepID=A0A060SUE9_PYCCI|nr:hypothetical protein BN946_scf184951.g7 [Trametes cinnabarina]
MVDDEQDRGFAALPLSLRTRIDAAFDSALRGSSSAEEPARKRRRLEATPQPGGFIAEDTAPGGFLPEEPAAGGFLVDEPLESDSPASGKFLANDEDDDASDSQRRSQIPMRLIPTALQILDLPPDDEDVLSVFRNAAAGWEGRGRTPSGRGEEEEAFVSRKDWRAVCAALLDTAAADDGEVDMEDVLAERDAETPSDLSEEYVGTGEDESEGGDEDDSDDEYRERGGGFAGSKKTKAGPKATVGTPTTKARRGRKTRATSESDEADEAERGLRGSRKEECRAAFALFFPDVPDEEVEMQRIRIKDITRVARLLKEKITAEETVEMLEAFSTASDKSMSLCDFERMMVAAKLV